jgi:hypothetical protein
MRMDAGQVTLVRKEFSMRHTGVLRAVMVLAITVPAIGVLTLAAILPATAADAKRPSGKRGVGFLPGYEPSEVVEWRSRFTRARGYWWGGPRFYRGRWNGGGFGPCWTQTPIGPHWNCG